MACEKCWGDAYLRSLVDGRAQSEHYHELLAERILKPCSKAEQEGKRDVSKINDYEVRSMRDRDIGIGGWPQ